MSEVKRYGHISYLVEATPKMVQLYPSMTIYTLASDFDAQRLRADTAEAENRILRHSNASFLETVAKVCDLIGIDLDDAKHADGQPSEVLFIHVKNQADKLAAAEQRIADLYSTSAIDAAAKKFAESIDYPWEHMVERGRASMRDHAKSIINAALNPNPEAESHE